MRAVIKDISLILPFHRDVGRLAETLAEIEVFRQGNPGSISEVILAHNGPHRFSKLPDPSRDVHLVHTDEAGIGFGYAVGLQKASSEWVLLSANDLPFGFSDLLAARSCEQRAEVFVGSKLHPRSDLSNYSSRRLIGSYSFYFMKRVFGLTNLPRDTQGTLLIRRTTALELLKKVKSRDFFFSTEFLYLAGRGGMAIVELPVRFRASSDSGSSVPLIRTGIWFFVKLLMLKCEWGARKLHLQVKPHFLDKT